jgi:hypothetical protein
MVARASRGRTPCNTPRAPSVSPTPTWGVPDVIVFVEGAAGAAGTRGAGTAAGAGAPDRTDATVEARVVLADCALSPRVAVGASLLVESATDRPASVVLARRADAAKLEASGGGGSGSSSGGADGAPRVLRLPIAGHAVAVALDAGLAYELSTSEPDPEAAWIVAPRPGVAAIGTDASGQAVLRGVSAGPHAVTAWLPPRAGQPARFARGTVTVTSGALAELTLALGPAPGP